MKKNRKIKLFLLIILILFFVYFQSIIFAAINSNLSITGDAVARIRSNVRINSFKIYEVSDSVISSYEDFSKSYTMSNVTLPNSDSYIIYELVIGNYEDVEMQLHSITGLNSNLTYELIDYNLNDMICNSSGLCTGGVEKTLYLKIKYATYDSTSTNYNVNLEYEFKEFSNVIAVGSTFKTTIPSTATHLVFTDERPSSDVVLTDLSQEQDMGVVGYLDGTTYKVSTRRTGIRPQANADSSYMFNGSTLTNIDFNNLYTNNVTNMSYMFADCSNLTDIVFGTDFNTENVLYMSYMFSYCTSLTSLDVSTFNTSNVTLMDRIFYHCESIVELNLLSFNTENVTSIKSMFNGCLKLTSLDLTSFNTENVTDMTFLFKLCHSIEALDISSFITTNVTTMSYMFEECLSLTSLDVSHLDTSKVIEMRGMFSKIKLDTLDLSNFDTTNVMFMTSMFSAADIISLDLSNFNTSKVKDMEGMFSSCIALQELNINNFDTKNVTNMEHMFYRCESLKELDMSFVTLKVKNMRGMFYKCLKLKSIDISTFDTSIVTDMAYMFYNCTNLEKIYVGDGWSIDSVTDSENMFTESTLLPNFDSTDVAAINAHYNDGGYLTYYIQNVSIDGISYQFKVGMIWDEWVNSEYNTSGIYIYNSYIMNMSGNSHLSINGNIFVSPSDIIDEETSYVFSAQSGGS